MRQTDTDVAVSDQDANQLALATDATLRTLWIRCADLTRMTTERDLLLSSLQGVLFMLELDPKLDVMAELRQRLKEYHQTAALLLEIQKENVNG